MGMIKSRCILRRTNAATVLEVSLKTLAELDGVIPSNNEIVAVTHPPYSFDDFYLIILDDFHFLQVLRPRELCLPV